MSEITRYSVLCGLFLVVTAVTLHAQPREVPLENADFSAGLTDGIPTGWQLYAQQDDFRRIDLLELPGGEFALHISDKDPNGEIGIRQSVAGIEAGETYRAAVEVRTAPGASSAGAHLQMRFLPSNTFFQSSLATVNSTAFTVFAVAGTAPPGTTALQLFIYTHAAPTPELVVKSVSLTAGVSAQAAPAPGIVPEPIPPVHEQLRELYTDTPLAAGGEAQAVIVTAADGRYDREAALLAAAVREACGVELPIVTDDTPQAALPLQVHIITLGNRSTNRTLGALYERFYCLEDLKYPGPGGYVVRSIHNPLGDGHNVIVTAGSDAAGVTRAAEVLAGIIRETAGADGALTLGWLMEIELGEGLVPPEEAAAAEIWEASVTYGSSGYFGWNILSKHLALYAMTGREFHAREFIRLAFPDEEAIAEIEKLDGERIENKLDPLAGPYHYSAHMMLAFWDLVEESPVFSDEERLRVINAFSRQLAHWAREGVYGRPDPAAFVGNRHSDWSAFSLWFLGRYFDTHHPAPVWDQALASAKLYFSALHDHAWFAGNNDHLFWYTSYYDPLLNYMIMSGDREALENSNLARVLTAQDVLFTGTSPDWGVRASSLNFLHRAAWLTGDGRFLFYRERTGLSTDVFRLGQSWWPDEDFMPRPPLELLNTWTVHEMPRPMWEARGSVVPAEDAFLWGSARSSLSGDGDYLLVKGHNGAGRNPYHTFSLLEMRLAGSTVLKGYRNQVLTSADGMVEPQVPMDAGLRHRQVIGDTFAVVGYVPNMAFSSWERSVVQRVGRYALAADMLHFRTDSENVGVVSEWHVVGGSWDTGRLVGRVTGTGLQKLPEDWKQFKALQSEYTCGPGSAGELLSRLTSIEIVLLKAEEPGTWIEMAFELKAPFAGEVTADLLDFKDRGQVNIFLNGQLVAENVEHYAPEVSPSRVTLGRHELPAGQHLLRVEVVGKNEASTRHLVGLTGATLIPDGAAQPAPAPGGFELWPADPLHGGVEGGVLELAWEGTAREGQSRHFFTLLAPQPAEDTLLCSRLSDNAAVLALPQPALAVCGEHDGITGELVILAADHLYGRAVQRAGIGEATVLTADAPVEVDWNFVTGSLTARNPGPTAATVQFAGQTLSVAPGEEATVAAAPDTATLEHLHEALADLVQASRQTREQRVAAASAPQEAPEIPAPATVMTAHTQENPAAVAVIAWDGREHIAVASGTAIDLVAADGTITRRLTTDGPVRVLHWWDEHRLLLAGCIDEKVIAFDESGARRWEFVSEMDRAVWEAAKQYWFKSAHPGIYGLHSGTFIDGQSQCFVGSACTLEILDENGRLVKRLPVFWGPGRVFALIPGPDESINLLIGRQPNDSHTLAIVNNRTFSVGRGFDGVPGEHTYVSGWDSMDRSQIFHTDLAGEGRKVVVSEVNGTWNRVTVWDEQGRPLYNAQFGPGLKAPARNIRGIDVGDITGDGRREIVVATAGGMVVALDHQCRKIWAQKMPAAPTALQIMPTENGTEALVTVGLADGGILVLDGTGKALARADLADAVAELVLVADADGPFIAAVAITGEIIGVRPHR